MSSLQGTHPRQGFKGQPLSAEEEPPPVTLVPSAWLLTPGQEGTGTRQCSARPGLLRSQDARPRDQH